MEWNRRGDIGDADQLHAVAHHRLARNGTFNVATRFGGEVEHNGSWSHAGKHRIGHENRRLAPRDQCGRQYEVLALDVVGDDRGVLCRLVLGLCAGVAARPLGLRCGLNELCAEGAHLFTGGGSHVKGAHHRTKASRRGNGLEAGDAGAKHKGLGRSDAPRRRG